MKKLFKVWTLFILAFCPVKSRVWANPLAQDAIWRGGAGDNPRSGLLHDVGLFEGSSVLPENYYVDSKVQAVFLRNQSLRAKMPAQLPADFDGVVKDIHRYIEANNSAQDEKKNGLLNSELSRRIVKASFCFGTDAKMVAAKIRMESVFAQNVVSPTGAVGFTQMTASGLEEANDQLGNRGSGHAPAANADYLRRAIRCYLGKDMKTMWEAGVIRKGQTLSGARLAAAKKWLTADVDRDLIYGQILLKVNLAATRAGSKSMLDNYSRAFVRYNGDTHKVGKTQRKYLYAHQVLSYFQNIDYDPNRDESAADYELYYGDPGADTTRVIEI